jgi:hypothetical protein
MGQVRVRERNGHHGHLAAVDSYQIEFSRLNPKPPSRPQGAGLIVTSRDRLLGVHMEV